MLFKSFKHFRRRIWPPLDTQSLDNTLTFFYMVAHLCVNLSSSFGFEK